MLITSIIANPAIKPSNRPAAKPMNAGVPKSGTIVPTVLLSAWLAGCASQPVVTIPVPEYVAVPAPLTASYPCGREVVTNGDLLSAYAECVESARKVEANLAAIRQLGVPH